MASNHLVLQKFILVHLQVFLCCWISLGWRLKDALFGGVGAINIKSTEKNSEAQLFGDGRLLRLKLSFKLAILMPADCKVVYKFQQKVSRDYMVKGATGWNATACMVLIDGTCNYSYCLDILHKCYFRALGGTENFCNW